MKNIKMMAALLVMVLLTGCQTTLPRLTDVKLEKPLSEPCEQFKFTSGKLLPQVAALAIAYNVCAHRVEALQNIIKPD